MSEGKPTGWQLVADEVLAAMIQSREAYETIRFDKAVTRRHFPPGPWANAFQAIDSLYLTDRPVHITTAHIETQRQGHEVALEWLSERWVLAHKAVLGAVLLDNIEQLKSFASRHHDITVVSEAAAALRRAETPEQHAAIVSDVVASLSASGRVDVGDVSATAASETLVGILDEQPAKTITTGIPWLDAQTGGIQPGHMWWIAAAYKRRKSTLARNMLLAACEAGASVTVGLLEGSQIELTAQLVAMLAVQWLHQNGHWEKRDTNGAPVHAITAPLLLSLRNRYKQVLHPLAVQAIGEGVKQFKAFGSRLRIYDRRAETGGLGTLASIEAMVRRDAIRHNADLCFIDYLQLIEAGRSSEYENVSLIARSLQRLAGETRVSMVVLAQLNEDTIRGPEGYSPGIKGGGDPAATADILLMTGYPKGESGAEDKHRLYIKVKLSRHGESGCSETFPLHPETGWLRTGVKVDKIDLAGF